MYSSDPTALGTDQIFCRFHAKILTFFFSRLLVGTIWHFIGLALVPLFFPVIEDIIK